MPKKKEKKIDEKDKDNKTQIRGTSAANYSGSDDKEKNLYLIQIRYLNEKLDRCQLKCEKLEGEKKELTTQLSVLENEKKDIVEYLKRALLEKEEEVDELTERLESQQEAADEDRDARQLLHNGLMQELQNRVNELATENGTLVERLADLEVFQSQKEQLMSKMKTMEKQLLSEEEEHQAAIHRLEIEVLMEKERLEKETENRAASMQAEIDHLVNQRVPEAVRSAMKETMDVKAQFSQLSEHALVLTEENSALRERRSQLSVDVGNLEQMLKEVSRQSCVQKKTIEKLKGNYQQAQHELNDCRHELKHLQTKHREVLAEIKAHRKSFSQTSASSRNTTHSAARFPTSRHVADDLHHTHGGFSRPT